MSKFSYNGTILYALPEWNKKTHPYALIRKKLGGDYVLILSTTLPLYGDTSESNSFLGVSYSSPHLESVSEFTLNTYAPWGELTEEDGTGISGSFVIWTNTDILNESDGNLYLAASEPVPITAPQLDPLSLFLGWKAGNWVARQRGKAKQPVAYLYNGVRLPKLPEWDKTVYPYIHISGFKNVDGSMDYHLFLEAAQAVVSADNTTFWYEDGSAFEHWRIVDGEWQKWYSSTNNEYTYKLSSRPLIWSNCNILNENNVVYLEASEPVPVYE